MPVPERRRTPRVALDRLAYIKIEPNNGGIVLNVSEHGLCFHSIVSVETGHLRFSLLESNRRIEAEGELAWMDEQQKVGGIRFTALSREAREQIQNLISKPSEVFEDEEEEPSNSPVPSGTRFPSLANRWLQPGKAPALVSSHEQTSSTYHRPFLTGFSSGLAAGLLIAVVVAAGFLFHNYRHQIGESLIRVGLHLSATPTSQAAQIESSSSIPQRSTSSTAQNGAPAIRTAPPAPPEKTVARTRPITPTSEPEKTPLQPRPATTMKVARSVPSAPSVQASTIAPPHIPSTDVLSISKLLPDKRAVLPQLETVTAFGGPARSRETEPPPPMFFEVGKFKQQSRAREVNDQLTQLRFPASITQKTSLFGSSYYVLVGPYDDPDAANDAHKSLSSSGFKARAFERGSRNFTLSSGVTLNGTKMSGDYVISWESYIPDAKVKFSQNDYVVTSADGRWVDRGVRTERNAFVYLRRGDGSHVLLEIRFEGMSKVLVFSRPS